jgi:hypothetical protein
MSEPIAITGVGTIPATGARGVELPLAELPETVRARALRAERITQLVLAAGGLALADAAWSSSRGRCVRASAL